MVFSILQNSYLLPFKYYTFFVYNITFQNGKGSLLHGVSGNSDNKYKKEKNTKQKL